MSNLPNGNTFESGELLKVTFGTSSWEGFWEKLLQCKESVIGYRPKDIDDSGMPNGRPQPVKVGTIVMYLGPIEQTSTKDSLVRVLYQEQIIAVMWECLRRP